MDLNTVIEQVGRDKGIDRETLIETLEAAILTAARRTYGPQREIEAQFNEDSGEVELFQIVTVNNNVENPYREVSTEEIEKAGFSAESGDELLFQIFYRDDDKERARSQDARFGELLKLESSKSTFGRIAAQTAKQVIIQRVREAERDIIFNEYKDRIGDMVTGIVRRFEKGNIIVDLGRADAILPRREQTPRESYRPGDRVQAMIKELQRSSRSPQVVLTRADPQLIINLFGHEVPEIYEGIVRIVAVGACVGMRGSRVQAVVQELHGEKIDIVPYVEDSARFVTNAISPAEVSKVLIDEHNMTMELIVPDDQLSLAIGRGGQNVRLAAQLTGWNLDIISETRLKTLMKEARESLLEFEGIDEDMVSSLFTLGYNKLEYLAQANIEELSQIPGINSEQAEIIIDAADEILARPAPGSPEAMTPEDYERQALEEIRGVGPKVAAKLYEAGYLKIESIAFARDTEAMAKAVGIPAKKGRQLWYAARELVQAKQGIETEEALELYGLEYASAKANAAAAAVMAKEAAAVEAAADPEEAADAKDDVAGEEE